MKALQTSMATLGAAVTTVIASTAGFAQTCEPETFQALGIDTLSLISVEPVAATDEIPVDHCRVLADLDQRTGIDGVEYAVGFELRLPEGWNGRFVHQFNGGNDGRIVPAVGNLLGGSDRDTALSRNYAVVSSNAGHRIDATPEAGVSASATFGLDPEARQDYGYGAVAKLHPVALQMVEGYYGSASEYVYGVGSSNGGRHALVAAARMPDAFDGLLAGYPGLNLPRAAIQHAWDVQAFLSLSSSLPEALSEADLKVVADAVTAACDGLDGLEDGIIADVDACQASFDIGTVACESGSSNACLPAEKVEVLRKIHQGPVTSDGEAVYSSWPWDAGIAAPGWRAWKLEGSNEADRFMPRIVVLGGPSLGYVFSTPPVEVGATADDVLAFLRGFDIDQGAEAIFATAEGFDEAAMTFMTPPDVDDPDLRAFQEAGGRLMMFHGLSDPVFSETDTATWYSALDNNHGGEASAFSRYYRVPGMVHGRGGPATDHFDMFSALVAWVEEGEEPAEIVATAPAGNPLTGEHGEMTRPLCPYPVVARYKDGDPQHHGSFTCD